MFEEIVFMNNHAAIWYTVVMVPLFITFLLVSLFQIQKVRKENEKLKKERDEAYGQSRPAEPLIEQGVEYEFGSGIGSTRKGRWVFTLIVRSKNLIEVTFCHLANPGNWMTDGLQGFAPEAGAIYVAELDEDMIKLNKKNNRSRH